MINPIKGLAKEDKAFFAGTVIAPIVVWWLFYGRKRYAMKGMK